MKKVIIDYSKRTSEKVVVVANNVSEKLYAVAIFTTPPVTKVALDAQIGVVVAAQSAAANKDRQKLAILRNQKLVLAGMLRQLAEYVNTTVTDGDEAKLLSSGFEIYKTPETGQLPFAIGNINAKFTNIAGSIDVSWSRARHAGYYNVFISADNGQTWTLLNTVFGRKLLVQQLVSGKRYQFKVVPVGVNGTGPDSDITSQVAA